MNRFKNWLFLNLANAVTVFGLIITFWLLVIAVNNPEQIGLIWFLAGIIGLTDFLDGKIAKSLKIKSNFGGALDRLRDKIFICPTLIILVGHYWPENRQSIILPTLTEAMVISLILIEILLIFVWFFGLFKKLDISANQYGRIKMCGEFIAVFLWLTSLTIEKYFKFPLFYFSIYLIDLILVATIYYAIKSLEGYWHRYIKPAN